MDARKLPLIDAFELASVLQDAITIDLKDSRIDVLDFVDDLLARLSPPQYLHCVKLLTGLDDNALKDKPSIEILTTFIEGLELNKVVTLLSFFKSMGL